MVKRFASDKQAQNHRNLSLVFVFDEGRALLQPVDGTDRPFVPSLFDCLCRASVMTMPANLKIGTFSIVLDTFSRFVDFLPPSKPSPGARIPIGKQLFDPFYLLPFWYQAESLQKMVPSHNLYLQFSDETLFSEWRG